MYMCTKCGKALSPKGKCKCLRLSNRTKIINDIHQERSRQDHLHPENLTLIERYVTLGEEMGEVAEALQYTDKDHLYQELIQVAAVAVRMAEQVIEDDH